MLFNKNTASYIINTHFIMEMTKKLKPFDLEASKAGAPVMTRDGRPVRILAFDVEGRDNLKEFCAKRFGRTQVFVKRQGDAEGLPYISCTNAGMRMTNRKVTAVHSGLAFGGGRV